MLVVDVGVCAYSFMSCSLSALSTISQWRSNLAGGRPELDICLDKTC